MVHNLKPHSDRSNLYYFSANSKQKRKIRSCLIFTSSKIRKSKSLSCLDLFAKFILVQHGPKYCRNGPEMVGPFVSY